MLTPILFLLAVQISLGAWISVAGSQRVLPMHGVLAMLVAGLAGWYALARLDGVAAKVLFAAALATPLAGMTSLHFEWSPLAALAHSSAAALLACAVTYAIARRA